MTSHDRNKALNSIQSDMMIGFNIDVFKGVVLLLIQISFDRYIFYPASIETWLWISIPLDIVGFWIIYDRIVVRKSTGWAMTMMVSSVIVPFVAISTLQKSNVAALYVIGWIVDFIIEYNWWRLAKAAKKLKRERVEDNQSQTNRPQSESQRSAAYGHTWKSNPSETGKPRNSVFLGERDLESDAYQIYLSEKYDAKFNPILGKYQLNQKLFADLTELLAYLHQIDKDKPSDSIHKNSKSDQLGIDAEEWFYKSQNGSPVGPRSLRFITSLRQNDYFFVRNANDRQEKFEPLYNVLAKFFFSSAAPTNTVELKQLLEIYGVSKSFIARVIAEREGEGSRSGWFHQNSMTKNLGGSLPLATLLTYVDSEHELIKHPALPDYVPLGIVRAIFQSHEKFAEPEEPPTKNSKTSSDYRRHREENSTEMKRKEELYKSLVEDPYQNRTAEFIVKIVLFLSMLGLIYWIFLSHRQ